MQKILLAILLAASVQQDMHSMAQIKHVAANMSTKDKIGAALGVAALGYVIHTKRSLNRMINYNKARANKIQEEQKILDNLKDHNQTFNPTSALALGVMDNDLQRVKNMCSKKADVNVPVYFYDKNGRIAKTYSPLMIAAEHGYTEIVQELLNAGADCLLEIDYKTAYSCAREARHVEIIDLLQINATERLLKAAAQNDVKVIEDALALGADIEGKNKGGCTPLLIALWNGNIGAICTLVIEGANKHAHSDKKEGVEEILARWETATAARMRKALAIADVDHAMNNNDSNSLVEQSFIELQ